MSARLVISTDDLAQHLDERDVLVVDARPPFFYAQGHIPGAVNLPLFFIAGGHGEPDAEAIAARLGRAGIERSARLVLYDDGATPTASHAAFLLKYLGHDQVAVLDGGITRWAHEGRELTGEPIALPPTEYEAGGILSDIWAGTGDVFAAMERSDAVIVDVRSPAEYLGLHAGAARNGHIPGAVNVEWSNTLIADDGVPHLRSADELLALYGASGVTPDKDVIVYCQSGSRSTYSWMVLRSLGFEKVRNYGAGWQEWGNRPDTPIEEQ
jgi:thiosulfate/3-mercaptopyruvate sulfurtransferase